MNRPHKEMHECMEKCLLCHDVCQEMLLGHCIEMGGRHTEPAHVRLMFDCMQICRAAADFMMRQSAHVALVCAACSVICQECADDCARLSGMERCAEACRQSAACCAAIEPSSH